MLKSTPITSGASSKTKKEGDRNPFPFCGARGCARPSVPLMHTAPHAPRFPTALRAAAARALLRRNPCPKLVRASYRIPRIDGQPPASRTRFHASRTSFRRVHAPLAVRAVCRVVLDKATPLRHVAEEEFCAAIPSSFSSDHAARSGRRIGGIDSTEDATTPPRPGVRRAALCRFVDEDNPVFVPSRSTVVGINMRQPTFSPMEQQSVAANVLLSMPRGFRGPRDCSGSVRPRLLFPGVPLSLHRDPSDLRFGVPEPRCPSSLAVYSTIIL